MAELQSVQAVPQGLLELLGMKGSGVNPRSLDSVVSPTIDARQMYALSKLSSPFTTAAAAVFPNEARLTVPDNEWWILMHMSALISVTANAPEYMAATMSIGYGATGLLPVTGKEWSRGYAAGLGLIPASISFVPPYPMLLRPGGALAARFTYAVTPGTTTATVNLQANVGVLS